MEISDETCGSGVDTIVSSLADQIEIVAHSLLSSPSFLCDAGHIDWSLGVWYDMPSIGLIVPLIIFTDCCLFLEIRCTHIQLFV